MNADHATARETAIAWAVRTHEADFDDWDGLEDWLAADPDHARLYDRVTIAAEIAVQPASSLHAANVSHLPVDRRGRKTWLPFAVAASLIAAVGGAAWFVRENRLPATLYAEATKPGERRLIVVGTAVRMALEGDTRVTLDRTSLRSAVLERGEALFTVTHDPDHPFSVKAGDVTITDIGTIFDVDRQHGATFVAVAEGAVRVSTPAGSVDVAAGRAVTIDRGSGTLVLSAQDSAAVGAWRSGRIDFSDMTIAELGVRIHRATGANIVIAPGIARRRVAGSIRVNGDIASTFRTLGPILGVAISRRGDVWTWSSPQGGSSS